MNAAGGTGHACAVTAAFASISWARIAEIETKNTTSVVDGQMVYDYLNRMKDLIKNKNDEDTQQHLVSQFLDKVILSKNDVECMLKILVTNGGGGPYRIKSTVAKHALQIALRIRSPF